MAGIDFNCSPRFEQHDDEVTLRTMYKMLPDLTDSEESKSESAKYSYQDKANSDRQPTVLPPQSQSLKLKMQKFDRA